MWPLGSLQASKYVFRWENHPGFETHGEGHVKSKTGAVSGLTKLTDQLIVQQKNFSDLEAATKV